MAQTSPEDQEVLRGLDFEVEPVAPKISWRVDALDVEPAAPPKVSHEGPPPPPVEPPSGGGGGRPSPTPRGRSGQGYFGRAALAVLALMMAVVWMDPPDQRAKDLPVVAVVMCCAIVIWSADDHWRR